MTRQISEGRKGAFYAGTALMIFGGLLFASVFVSGIANFGNFENFHGNARSMAARAFGGMALMMVGGIIHGIGARGLAGSGVILDPEQAREDLEPYSRMTGGMIKDTLDEADIHLGGSTPERVVMIKCPHCSKLNEEDSKFCQECGRPL
ncbi:MAG TPA: zinc-ribbon domain-containing protein [bacterium]|nr:zinc-ribbon domain-containing protein [bacterium]HPO08743.1 zinc-ribbon domain-containing protein [bacterium]HQO34595.1 zinc-ribbon domain-containing protein [bacterium]HQP97254.1 zinc-ribbon domain-containing protein [bacterium]